MCLRGTTCHVSGTINTTPYIRGAIHTPGVSGSPAAEAFATASSAASKFLWELDFSAAAASP